MAEEKKQEGKKQEASDLLVGITDAEKEEFRDAFKLFDKDGDGVITVDEIYEVFQSLGFTKWNKKDIKKMVAAVDIDGNGEIDLDEFIVLLRSKQGGANPKLTAEKELEAAFNVFDKDGGGSIDAAELAHIMQSLGEKLTEQDIQFMIKAVDDNNDGEIDLQEFKAMMKLAPIPSDTISKIKQ
eukprot:UN13076